MDHANLLSKDDPRVVAGKPLESLMLTKPISDEEHEGANVSSKEAGNIIC